MEDLLANVVMLNELKMQQFWPAYKAVAKLQHETITSEIQSIQLDV